MPLLLLFILFSLPSLSVASTADSEKTESDRWFQVELILFQRNSTAEDDEVWPMDPGSTITATSVELFPPLPDESKRLLSSSPVIPFLRIALEEPGIPLPKANDLTVLAHIRWLQPAIKSDLAPAVHIALPQATNAIIEKPLQAETIQSRFELPLPPSEDDNEALPTTSLPAPANIIDGIVRLSLNRHLHFDLDLLYQPKESPLAQDKPENIDPVTDNSEISPLSALFNELPSFASKQTNLFRLHQSRRIKVDEINYFDHPYLGALVKVSRYDNSSHREMPANPAQP